MPQMRCSHSYMLNKYVFSLRQNISSPTSDVCSSAGRLPRTRCLDGETAVAVSRPGAGNSQSTGVSRAETSPGDS